MCDQLADCLLELYVDRREELFTYAMSITRNTADAEDAVHTAFQNVLRRRTMPENLKSYVFRSVRNSAIDAVRNSCTGAETVFEQGTEVSPSFDHIDLDASLNKLAADEREIIVLKVFCGMTFREIADTRDQSINTVASWYRRGLEKLRRDLR
jgi:RNA polymerase sigma-70 factor (ECF subfamily)